MGAFCWFIRIIRSDFVVKFKFFAQIDINPFEGIGKPEPLKYNYQGLCSRRIDEVNRLVYKIENDEIYIIS